MKLEIDADVTPINAPSAKQTKKKTEKAPVKKTAAKTSAAKSKTAAKAKKTPSKAFVKEEQPVTNLREEVRVVFKKALTDREQKVFDHFAEHKNQIVYAKDLAALLDLPRDYVYKYIKNLRAKIEGEKLQNADKGGFILHI